VRTPYVLEGDATELANQPACLVMQWLETRVLDPVFAFHLFDQQFGI
jgi:hypothetical protein